MATSSLSGVVGHLRRVALLPDGGGLTDGQLLERFVAERSEAAFEALVRRHGPMVWGVCRRVLRHQHDAEDAFQATFLVLARKAATIARRDSVGSWLYGTAYRAALEAKAARRRSREEHVGAPPEPAVKDEPDDGRDVRPLLDRELSRLPDVYREAVVLCDLEGLTRREAARQLGVPEGTLSGRLTTARRLLARRLARCGLSLSGTALAVALSPNAASAAVPAALAASTTLAAAPGAAAVSASVAALTEGVLKAMFLSQLKLLPALFLTAVLLVCGVAGLAGSQAGGRPAAEPPAPVAGKEPAPKAAPAWGVRAALEGHADAVGDVAYSRDGKLLATASRDGKARVYDAATGRTLATLEGHDGEVRKVAFAPDGKAVATAGEDRTVRVWDPATGREVRRLAHADPVRGVAFTPDGKTLLAWGGVPDADGAGGRGELRRWDPATGEERKPLSQVPKTRVENVLVSPDGKALITGSGSTLTIWDWDGKDQVKERRSIQAEESAFIYGLALSPDAATLAVATDGTVKLYDAATGKAGEPLEKAGGVWGELQFSTDGKAVTGHVVIQEKDGDWVVQRRSVVRTWDAATGKVHETVVVEGAVRSAALAPDGKTLAVGFRGGVKFQEKDDGTIDLRSIDDTEKVGAVKLLERK